MVTLHSATCMNSALVDDAQQGLTCNTEDKHTRLNARTAGTHFRAHQISLEDLIWQFSVLPDTMLMLIDAS